MSWCLNLVAPELFEAQVHYMLPIPPGIKDTLKELKMLHTVLDPWKLSKLMEALPNLENFSYVEGVPNMDSPHNLPGSAWSIKQALLSKAAILRSLELNLTARQYRMNKPGRLTDDQLLGSLRDMAALKKLVLGALYVTVNDISMSFTDDMVLVELLPASICSIKPDISGSEYTKSAMNFSAVINLTANVPERFLDLRVA